MSRSYWPHEVFGHKIWDAVWMTPLKVFGNIRSIEKSPLLSVCSDAKKANLTGIQPDLSSTPYFKNAS